MSESTGKAAGDLVDLVLDHAAARPGSPALQDDLHGFSYADLADQVSSTAAGLALLGVEPGDRVALVLANSTAFVIAALGCMWVGAVFVPFSPEDPPLRRERLLDRVNPALVISDAVESGSDAPAGTGRWRNVGLSSILAGRGGAVPRARDLDRDAYIIFTSGTTGDPKGIRTPVGSLQSAVTAAAQAMGLDSASRALCVSPLHFDGSYGTAFATLAAGGFLVIPPRHELQFGKRFYRSVLEDDITHTGFTPSYLRLLLASPQMASLRSSRLRTLGLGGEQCSPSDLAKLWAIFPEIQVFNRYGPTEATIQVTTYHVDPSDATSGVIPVGEPHPGVDFYLVSDDGGLIDDAGVTGELLIGGRQLMRGYWEDDAATARVLGFDASLGVRVLRTGDLAYRDARGRYFIVGRRDGVVKRRGVRISLDEIERVLESLESVSAAVCVTTADDDQLGIAAFVTIGSGATPASLLEAARRELPDSMLPDDLFVVDRLPIGSSGKVDRAQLRCRRQGVSPPV